MKMLTYSNLRMMAPLMQIINDNSGRRADISFGPRSWLGDKVRALEAELVAWKMDTSHLACTSSALMIPSSQFQCVPVYYCVFGNQQSRRFPTKVRREGWLYSVLTHVAWAFVHLRRVALLGDAYYGT